MDKICFRCKEKARHIFPSGRVSSYCLDCIREMDRENSKKPENIARKRKYDKEHKKEYYQRPDVKARKSKYDREYSKRPEQREYERCYKNEYYKRPEAKAKKTARNAVSVA